MNRVLSSIFFCLLFTSSFSLMSCSENDDTADEYENWEERNNQFFATLEDSLQRNSGTGVGQWQKFKSFSKDPSLQTGANTDCVYVKVLKATTDSATLSLGTPLYADSILVSYQGRFIPSPSYPNGLVFDGTAFSVNNMQTNGTARFKISSLVDGFATAVMQMHKGDVWRVYIPWNLGYGSSDYNTIPAYSTLIFDIAMVDFAAAGKALPTYR